MEYLPVETLLHIFRYIPSQPASFLDSKTDIYHTALTCRTFYQLAMPILWAEFTLTLDPRDNYRRLYQKRFLETLTLDSAKNFVYTKELRLHFSLGAVTISESSQCMATKTDMDNFVRVYEYAEPHVKKLLLKVEPFIPTDCATDSLWPLLNKCNDSIYHCLGRIAHRPTDFEVLVAEIGRDGWAFDIEYRPHLQQMLWLLGPRITKLEIAESPFFINNWLPTMRRLRSLSIRNVGTTSDENLVAMWSAISNLRLKWLALSGVKFPPNIQRYISRTLTSLFLVGLDDVVTACLMVFTQMPQLERCAFNMGKRKCPREDGKVVIHDTVCTKLVQACFYDAPIPAGLISVVARNNPRLALCGAPPNLSDEDMLNLQKHCSLDSLIMSDDLNMDQPAPLLTKTGLAEITRMPTIRYVRLNGDHLQHMNEQFIRTIARNCKRLHILGFTIPLDRRGSGDWGKENIRAELRGSEEFKDWILGLWHRQTTLYWEICVSPLHEKSG
jgi:hypothetical protein